MRATAASLFIAAVSTAALLLTTSAAAAQPPAGAGTTVTPYEECVDLTRAIRTCTTGTVTVRRTTTPSGNTSGSVIDNGRFESVNSETGCTTSGSFHGTQNFLIGPEALGRITLEIRSRDTIRTRCGDRTVDSTCASRSTLSVVILPGEARMEVTNRIRGKGCDPLA